jgi:hypothetical protein
MIRREMPIKGSLIAPHFLHMDETGVENVLCVTVFYAAIFSSAAFHHAPHQRPRIR